MNKSSTITTHPKPHCYSCGAVGKPLYQQLPDRLFQVDGNWNLDICTNEECQLIWLNPMPIEEDLPKLYENYYTHNTPAPSKAGTLVSLFRQGCTAYIARTYGYMHQPLSWLASSISHLIRLNPAWTANLDFSTFYIQAKLAGKLLEIGCGSGQMLKVMQNRGWDVTGVDFDPKSVLAASKLGLNVLQGDISQQDFPAESFDVIVMSHVIEHLPDPIATLRVCHSLLRPNGKLIAITPNTTGYIHRYFKQSSLHLDPPRHLHLFRQKPLQHIALQAGFEEAECHSTIRDFSGLWWASANIKRHGTHRMGEPAPLKTKLLTSLLAVIAGYALKMRLGEGDELVLTAKK